MTDPPPPRFGTSAAAVDRRAERLARALRANLRRRKAPAAPAREGDGADGDERLYPCDRGASGGG